MTTAQVHLAGIGAVPADRLVKLRHLIEQASRPAIASVVFRTLDSDVSAHVLRLLQGLHPSPFSRDDEPLPEHIGPVVTSFDQALYLMKKGLL